MRNTSSSTGSTTHPSSDRQTSVRSLLRLTYSKPARSSLMYMSIPMSRRTSLIWSTRPRNHADVSRGGSPRASLTFIHTSKARAVIHGRGYVIPADVKALAHPVLTHRLLLSTDAELSDVTNDDVVSTIEPPGSVLPDDQELPGDGQGRNRSPSLRFSKES